MIFDFLNQNFKSLDIQYLKRIKNLVLRFLFSTKFRSLDVTNHRKLDPITILFNVDRVSFQENEEKRSPVDLK